jgi:hypothetical protein
MVLQALLVLGALPRGTLDWAGMVVMLVLLVAMVLPVQETPAVLRMALEELVVLLEKLLI